MNRDKAETFFSLRSSMDHFDEMDLEDTDLEAGYHPTTKTFNEDFLVVKRMTTRSKHRGSGRRPDDLHLEVYKLDEVSVSQLRTWKQSDSVELEELSHEELWERVLGDEQNFVDRKELRDEGEE